MKIGDIAVVPKGTENPYKASIPGDRTGKKRAAALGLFLRGVPTPEYEFWFAPCCGGARKLSEADIADVDPVAVNYYWDEAGRERPRR